VDILMGEWKEGYTDGGVEGGIWSGEWLRWYIFTLPLSFSHARSIHDMRSTIPPYKLYNEINVFMKIIVIWTVICNKYGIQWVSQPLI
jgi:hypothetical protein